MKKPLVQALSMVAIIAAGGVQAGKIISNDTEPRADGFQFGFGGWNLDNVDVEITAAIPEIFALPKAHVDSRGDVPVGIAVGSFDRETGEYTLPLIDPLYDSYIYDRPFFIPDTTNIDPDAVAMGVLHGKDYPVGEPAGIKIINDDFNVKNGKPQNCIMTTSYLDPDVLGTDNPVTTSCSSPFQSHKRFKVNVWPSTLDDVGQESADLVFNVEDDGGSRDYQVFQKVNNYSDSQIESFTIEVGFGVGADFQKVRDASIALTSELSVSTPIEIGTDTQLATFSHGLFGSADANFPTDGFFDSRTAGFFVTVDEYAPDTGIGPGDSFHSNGTMDSNYLQVPPTITAPEQFGTWMPSIWAPKGIFFDDDNDPNTDAQLLAFFGDTTGTPSPNYGWMLGDVDDFAPPTDEQYLAWVADPLYFIDVVEDVLNLGLNYVVTVGSVDDTWPTWDAGSSQATFTIRVTPTKNTGIGEPGYVANAPTELQFTNSLGVATIVPNPQFYAGDDLALMVGDADLNADPGLAETVGVVAVNGTSGESEAVTLTESGLNTGAFSATIGTIADPATGTPNDGTMNVVIGDVVTLTYIDADDGNGNFDVTVTATSTVAGTGLCGNIDSSITYTAANGPYVITCDLVIAAAADVVFEAGTNILVQDGHSISVAGTLVIGDDAGPAVSIMSQNPGTATHLIGFATTEGTGTISFGQVGMNFNVY